MTWQVFLTTEAEKRLLAIKDRRIKKLLYARAMKLQESPEQQGKSLIHDLAGVEDALRLERNSAQNCISETRNPYNYLKL